MYMISPQYGPMDRRIVILECIRVNVKMTGNNWIIISYLLSQYNLPHLYFHLRYIKIPRSCQVIHPHITTDMPSYTSPHITTDMPNYTSPHITTDMSSYTSPISQQTCQVIHPPYHNRHAKLYIPHITTDMPSYTSPIS